MTLATFVPMRISFSNVGRGIPRICSYQPDSSSMNSSIDAMRSFGHRWLVPEHGHSHDPPARVAARAR